MFRHRSVAVAVVTLCGLTAVRAGPVQYVSQNRVVSGSLNEVYQVGDPDVDPPEEVSASDSRSAADFGVFDEVLTVSVVPPTNQPRPEPSGTVEAAQRSTLDDSGITATGHLSGHTGTEEGFYGVSTLVDVTFDLDEARDYDLTFSVSKFHAAGGRTSLLLAEEGGSPVFEEVLNFLADGGVDTVAGGRSGTLAPGRYRFVFDHSVGGEGTDGDFAVALDLPGATTNPIPLPGQVWPAIATLLVAGAAGARRCRPH